MSMETMSTEFIDASEIEGESCEVIEEGPVSTISRADVIRDICGKRTPLRIAIKSASTRPEFSKEPHDIIKEVRALSSVSHPNIICILGRRIDAKPSSLQFWMPYISHSLPDILSSPSFTPLLVAEADEPTQLSREGRFVILAKSLMFQITTAVAYLHDHGIAHRDIKPSNCLLTEEGLVKLIDFGMSYNSSEDPVSKRGDLWPEYPDEMYFEVSTGPYRAPELLFGPRSYDPFAIDLWSLGATFADFFTSLKLVDDPSDSDSDDDQGFFEPFLIPRSSHTGARRQVWIRDTLFNSERGEIGLAWSIFRIRGTPTDDNWPTFKDLPHASSVTFISTPPVLLSQLLPNLPPPVKLKPVESEKPSHSPPPVAIASPLDMLHRLLLYMPSTRLKAAEALRHPWFTAGLPLILPENYPLGRSVSETDCVGPVWEGKSLAGWLYEVMM